MINSLWIVKSGFFISRLTLWIILIVIFFSIYFLFGNIRWVLRCLEDPVVENPTEETLIFTTHKVHCTPSPPSHLPRISIFCTFPVCNWKMKVHEFIIISFSFNTFLYTRYIIVYTIYRYYYNVSRLRIFVIRHSQFSAINCNNGHYSSTHDWA